MLNRNNETTSFNTQQLNRKEQFDREWLHQPSAKLKNIHLVGIGGIGMSGLALLFKERGFFVQGSDIMDNDNVKLLRKEGIKVYIEHKKENITQDIDLIGYSSAIKEDNPEIAEAKHNNIIAFKRGELLGLLSEGKKTIAVAGSHGKTTTTALVGYFLTTLGYNPALFVGGIPLNYFSHARWGGEPASKASRGEYFVIETDESDGSFLYCNPWVSIITNIDYEHLDYYVTMDCLKNSMLQFARQTKDLVIGCGDHPKVADILHKVKGWSYGLRGENKIRGDNITFSNGLTSFDLSIDKKFITRVKINLLGEHNVLNSLAICGFAYFLGEDMKKAGEILDGFKGVKRRFQVKEVIDGVTFVDDYAHHPSEIEAVLKAARVLNPHKLFVIFQPHRFSRVKLLYNEFSRCFSAADELVVTDIYSASEDRIDGIDGNFIFSEIKKNFSGGIQYVASDKLSETIPSMLTAGDIVLGVGAGNINIIMGGIIQKFKNMPHPDVTSG